MKGFWIVMSILFAIFLTLYISQAIGYYDYEQYKKVELTSEKIAEFEQDIKDGKEIDIKDYLENVNIDYNNSASKAGLKLSSSIKKYVRTGIDGTLSFFFFITWRLNNVYYEKKQGSSIIYIKRRYYGRYETRRK